MLSYVLKLLRSSILIWAITLVNTLYAQAIPINLTDGNFRNDDLLKGVTATSSECAQIEQAVWAQVGTQESACIRYWTAGFPAEAKTALSKVLIYIPGDQLVAGLPEASYPTRNPKAMQELANSMQSRLGVPFILLSTLGTFGSSGEHSQRRRPLESKLMDSALNALKTKHHIENLAIIGLSGGGHILASLLNMRSDIICAVLASAVTAPKLRWTSMGLNKDVTGYADSYEPIDNLDLKTFHPQLKVYVLGDLMDTNVPWHTQLPYAEKLKSLGANVELLNGTGSGPQRHALGESGRVIGSMCLRDAPNSAIKVLEKAGLKG